MDTKMILRLLKQTAVDMRSSELEMRPFKPFTPNPPIDPLRRGEKETAKKKFSSFTAGLTITGTAYAWAKASALRSLSMYALEVFPDLPKSEFHSMFKTTRQGFESVLADIEDIRVSTIVKRVRKCLLDGNDGRTC